MCKCNLCDDNYFILSTNETGKPDVQKCDECNKFKSDDDAKLYVFMHIFNDGNLLNIEFPWNND